MFGPRSKNRRESRESAEKEVSFLNTYFSCVEGGGCGVAVHDPSHGSSG